MILMMIEGSTKLIICTSMRKEGYVNSLGISWYGTGTEIIALGLSVGNILKCLAELQSIATKLNLSIHDGLISMGL